MSTPSKSSTAPPGAVPKPKVLPPGYKWVNGTVQIDPQQAERIRDIFRQYAAER